MSLRILSAVTGFLFVISLGVFYMENRKGVDLVEGSDYIKGLDVEKINKISLSFTGDKSLTFERDGTKFVISNHKAYPASTKKINDLIYKIASLQVKEKVASKPSEKDLEEYELNPKSRRYFIEIYDNSGAKTVSFFVGKSQKNRGNYLYKEEGDAVYLSRETIDLDSSHQDFLDIVLIDIKKDEIESVELETDDIDVIELVKKDKKFSLVKPPKKDFKEEEVEEYFGNFSNLRLDGFYKHDEKEVQVLSFDKKNQCSPKQSIGLSPQSF